MSDPFKLSISPDGVRYYDYSEFMGIPSGIILRNDDLTPSGIDSAIRKNAGFYTTDNNNLLTKLNQKHTNVIIQASENDNQPADGVYTRSENHLLTIRTADCFPLLLYDGRTAAAIHLGWRSALAGILNNFFARISDFNYREARAVIGPGIGACCFEVSSEVALLFDSRYRRAKNNRYFVDLNSFILDELAGYGIQYLLDNGACTVCGPEWFYSYRREGSAVKQMLSYIYPRRSR